MHFIAKTSLSLALSLAVASAFFACAGTKGTDPGPIVAADSAPDVKIEAAPPGPKCVDASIDELPLPDASIPDSGIDTSQCFACLKSTCKDELNACNENCDCREVVVNFLTCSAKMPSAAQSCAITAFGSASGAATQLSRNVGTCALLGCQKECIPAVFLDAGSDASPGTDAGDDAGDASM